MPTDFPSSPTIGEIFEGLGGAVYTWDGVKWVSGSCGAQVRPAPPNTSIQWNNGGVFGGSQNLLWDNGNSIVLVGGDSPVINLTSITDNGDGTFSNITMAAVSNSTANPDLAPYADSAVIFTQQGMELTIASDDAVTIVPNNAGFYACPAQNGAPWGYGLSVDQATTNVGVRSVTPANPLTVGGRSETATLHNDSPIFVITNDASYGTGLGALGIGRDETYSAHGGVWIQGFDGSGVGFPCPIVLQPVAGGGLPSEYGVGIGKLPGYALDVSGDLNITGRFFVNGTPLSIGQAQTPWLQDINGNNFSLSGVTNLNVTTIAAGGNVSCSTVSANGNILYMAGNTVYWSWDGTNMVCNQAIYGSGNIQAAGNLYANSNWLYFASGAVAVYWDGGYIHHTHAIYTDNTIIAASTITAQGTISANGNVYYMANNGVYMTWNGSIAFSHNIAPPSITCDWVACGGAGAIGGSVNVTGSYYVNGAPYSPIPTFINCATGDINPGPPAMPATTVALSYQISSNSLYFYYQRSDGQRRVALINTSPG